jgi:hypothetical protein
MELTNVDEKDNCIICYKIDYFDYYHCIGFEFPAHTEILPFYDSDMRTILCIAYPKGKRPALPYPQNPSKIELNKK